MSNQSEPEMQPTPSPEDVRQALLMEREASQQAIEELSEEHLQAISGGCGQCIKDLDKAKHSQRVANGVLRSVQAAAERGDIDAAYRSLNTAKGNIRRAQWFLNRVTARGHHLPPDGNLPTY